MIPFTIEFDFGILVSPSQAQKNIDLMMARELEHQFEIAQAIAESTTAFKDHTYKLRRSIKHEVTGVFSQDTLEARLWSTKRHGAFIEYGTRPHDIRPRRKKFLAWKDGAGNWHFAKKVRHPGTNATMFLHNSVNESVIAESLRKALILGMRE